MSYDRQPIAPIPAPAAGSAAAIIATIRGPIGHAIVAAGL
jgi:hypothetical protein